MKKIAFIVCLVLTVSLLMLVTIAASVNGEYQGNPIINVIVNGVKLTGLDVPAISLNGRTLLPLRACVENVNGIVNWDGNTQTASVLKPEVDVYFVTYGDDGKTISDVDSSIPVLAPGKKFYSKMHICGLPKGSYEVKTEIIDPNNKFLLDTTGAKIDIDDSVETIITTEFDSSQVQLSAGIYKFKVYMKDGAGVYKTVAVKNYQYK